MTRHLDHPGHELLTDGSLVRLDLELGQFVATWYSHNLTVRYCRRGSREEMTAVIDAWVTGFYEGAA